MIKFPNIQLGMTDKQCKTLMRNYDDFALCPFPAFVETKYKSLYSLNTGDELFILFRDGIVIDITDDKQKVIDYQKSIKNIECILENLA